MEWFQSAWEKYTKSDNSLIYKSNGKVFTLRGDLLKTVTDYNSNATVSLGPKTIIKFLNNLN